MERVIILPGLGRLRSASLSAHTFIQDDTDVISESEEINEVKSLLKKAEKLLMSGKLSEAVQCYSDALEIDERSVEVLSSRASTYLSLKDYQAAYKDSERLISLDSEKPEAHYLQAVTLDYMGRSEEAMAAFLHTLSLDLENASILTDHIVSLAGKLGGLTAEKIASLKGAVPYRKLAEIGSALTRTKHFSLSVQVLNAAKCVATNQNGITIKVSLMLGQAHQALGQQEQALLCYQDSYTWAVKTHDDYYQTKSLINLATLLMERGEIHQAIYYFELLLDLENELLSLVGELPNYWVPSLRFALRLNLCLAYKSIGDLSKAQQYANMYLECVDLPTYEHDTARESLLNIGITCELTGRLDDAIVHYKRFLQYCKGDKEKTAKTYGCLGNVYANLHNWRLAQAYCEQRCEMAQSLCEDTLKSALGQLADLYYKRWINSEFERCRENSLIIETPRNHDNRNAGNEKIVDVNNVSSMNYLQRAQFYYGQLIELCKFDWRTRCKALYGMAKCYVEEKHHSTAAYHLDTALHLAESSGSESNQETGDVRLIIPGRVSQSQSCFKEKMQLAKSRSLDQTKTRALGTHLDISEPVAELQTQITQLLAECLSWSLSEKDLKKSVGYFTSLIPIYQERIKRCTKAGVLCPAELPVSLRNAYTRLTVALVRLGRARDALCYAETSRDCDVTGHYDDVALSIPDVVVPRGISAAPCTYDKILQTVTEYDVTVIYYALIGQLLITWVIKAVDGLVNWTMNQYPGDEVGGKIERALDTYHDGNDLPDQTSVENRALPQRGGKISIRQIANQNLAGATSVPVKPMSPLETCPLTVLYDLLIKPINPYLLDCKSIVIVPDSSLWQVPFSILPDGDTTLGIKYTLTLVPSFMILANVTSNYHQKLQAIDDLESQRKEARYGGVIHEMGLTNNASSRNETVTEVIKVDPKRTSHPRLVHFSGKVLSPGGDVTIEEVVADVSKEMTTQFPPFADTITSKTWTGTDIMTSSQTVTRFQQITSSRTALCMGNPALPANVTLHGSSWKPSPLTSAEREVRLVAKYLNVTAVTGARCTKDFFRKNILHASILHLATWMCPDNGYVALAPLHDLRDSVATSGACVHADWLVTCKEIVEVGCRAELVVLSGGWYAPRRRSERHGKQRADEELLLPRAFILAGAECVLYVAWPITDVYRERFFSQFYASLSSGCRITEAFNNAASQLRGTCPFMLIGRDSYINLTDVQSAMLDQAIDREETEVVRTDAIDYLNPQKFTELPTKESQKAELQSQMADLSRVQQQQQGLVPALLNLLDFTLRRIHGNDESDLTITLDSNIIGGSGQQDVMAQTCARCPGVELLKSLGYHFQARGTLLTIPFVILPHSTEDLALVTAYDCLRALMDIGTDVACLRAVGNYLPQPQKQLSAMIDLLCLSKHVTRTLQLRLSDQTIGHLWRHTQSRDLMTSLGFHQIGPLLGCRRTPESRRLQQGVLQLLLCLSAIKDPILMHKIDANKLGHPISVTSSIVDQGVQPIPSLEPVQVDADTVRLVAPWLSRFERGAEMNEKMALTKRKKLVDREYEHELSEIESWHRQTLVDQAKETLSLVGAKPAKPTRVKVLPVRCITDTRVPVDYQPPLTRAQVHDRRTYAHYVLRQRINAARTRQQQNTKKCFLPYIRNSVM